MVQFVSFQDKESKTSVLINPAHIIYVSMGEHGVTVLRMSNGQMITITQTQEQFQSIIKKHQGDTGQGA